MRAYLADLAAKSSQDGATGAATRARLMHGTSQGLNASAVATRWHRLDSTKVPSPGLSQVFGCHRGAIA